MLGGTDREGTGGDGNEECEGPIMGGCEEEGWEIGEGEDGLPEGGEVEDIGATARGEAEEMGVTEGGIAILGVPEDDVSEGKEDDDFEGKGDVDGRECDFRETEADGGRRSV